MITAVQKQDIYEVRFSYNPEVLQLVKNVPGRKYVPEQKYWTIPVDRIGFLIEQFKNTPYSDQLKIYSAEHIYENATLDATNTAAIPDVDLSKIPLYVQEGKYLFQHQKDFMKFAIDRQKRGLYSGFLLADEQGLGKTIEGMNLALYNKKYNKIKHCLIIACVNSAKYNWVDDIIKHTNGEYVPYILGSRLKRDGTVRTDGGGAEKLQDLMCGHMYGKKEQPSLPFFLVINIEAFHYRKDRHYLIRERLTTLLNKGTIGMVILDEVHRNCSPSSKQGKQILKLKKDCTAKVEWLPMTGTPIVNKPTDVFTPLKLIDGHTYNSYYNWCENFCVYGNFGDIIGYKNIPQLKQMLQGNMLRRLKSEVLDLPPKLHTIEYVENTAYQDKLYKKVLLDTINHKDDILSSNNPMVKMLKLRQVNGSPELIDQNLKVDKAYLAKNSKMARLIELVSTIVANGEKVVIFSNWVESLRTIYRFLAKDYNICCYTGTMKQEDREKDKQTFINDPSYPVMIGTVGALGVSHTLTVANNVIFYDLPWNPATMEQAEDRCHRTGTTSTVNVYSIITKDTVDEKVYKLIQDKDGISKFIVDNQLSFKQHPELFDILFGKG